MKYRCQLSAYHNINDAISSKSTTLKALELPEYGPVRIIDAATKDEAMEKYYDLFIDDFDPGNYLSHLICKPTF